MPKDLKYDFPGGIKSREGGYMIPDDEWTFIARGKDWFTPILIRFYRDLCLEEARRWPEGSEEAEHLLQHAADALGSLHEITKFQEENPERVGFGCTTLGSLLEGRTPKPT